MTHRWTRALGGARDPLRRRRRRRPRVAAPPGRARRRRRCPRPGRPRASSARRPRCRRRSRRRAATVRGGGRPARGGRALRPDDGGGGRAGTGLLDAAAPSAAGADGAGDSPRARRADRPPAADPRGDRRRHRAAGLPCGLRGDRSRRRSCSRSCGRARSSSAVKAESPPTRRRRRADRAAPTCPSSAASAASACSTSSRAAPPGAMTGFSHPEGLRAALDAYARRRLRRRPRRPGRRGSAGQLRGPGRDRAGAAQGDPAPARDPATRRRSGRPRPSAAGRPAAGCSSSTSPLCRRHFAAGGLMDLGLTAQGRPGARRRPSGSGAPPREALAAEGAHVVVVGRREELVDERGRALPSAVGVVADLPTPDAPASASSPRRARRSGRSTCWSSTAAARAPGAGADLDRRRRPRRVDLLLPPHVALVQEVLPGMRERGWGRILAIGSSGVQQPIPNLAAVERRPRRAGGYLKTLAGEVAARRRHREHGAARAGSTPTGSRPLDAAAAERTGKDAARGPRRVRGGDPRRPVRRPGGVRRRRHLPGRRAGRLRHRRAGALRRRPGRRRTDPSRSPLTSETRTLHEPRRTIDHRGTDTPVLVDPRAGVVPLVGADRRGPCRRDGGHRGRPVRRAGRGGGGRRRRTVHPRRRRPVHRAVPPAAQDLGHRPELRRPRRRPVRGGARRAGVVHQGRPHDHRARRRHPDPAAERADDRRGRARARHRPLLPQRRRRRTRSTTSSA